MRKFFTFAPFLNTTAPFFVFAQPRNRYPFRRKAFFRSFAAFP